MWHRPPACVPVSKTQTRGLCHTKNHEFVQRYKAFASAAGPVQVAEGAHCLDGHRYGVIGDWHQNEPGGIRFFVAGGVHVFSEPCARRVVSGDGPSFERRRLVGGHAPRLRTYCGAAVSLAGNFISAGRVFCETHLFLDDDCQPAYQLFVECQTAGVHDAWILYCVGGFLRHLVVVIIAPAFLVAEAG